MNLKKYWQLVVLFIVWGFIFFPLFGPRFIPTHDGEYHLIRIHEFSKMLAAGNLFPRWAPDLNSGYGFPLFIFHYPLPNYIGSIFHLLGAPLVQSFQMSIAVGILIAGLGSYLFLQKETEDKNTALTGTLLLFTIPYLFVDSYIRGSIGEVWAIAFGFCSLASIVWNKRLFLAISIALIILSHNIMAMILIPLISLYAWGFYRKLLVHVILGIFLSTYFWLPALAEQKNVIGLNSVTFSDHFPTFIQLLFPSWGSNFSQPGIVANEMSQQIGVIPIFVVILNLVQYLMRFWSRNGFKKASTMSSAESLSFLNLSKGKFSITKRTFFFTTLLISIFLMFSFSTPIWRLFSFLQYIQYPWRLLSVLLVTIPFLASTALKNSHPMFKCGIVILSFAFVFPYMQPVLYEPRSDEYYLSKKEFTDGTSSMGNSFTTIWTSWKQKRFSTRVEVINGDATTSSVTSSATSDTFNADSKMAADLKINRLYYPGWKVYVNKKEVPINYKQDGTLIFTVKEGRSNVVAIFKETPLRIVADIISLCSLVTIGILGFHSLKKKTKE